MNYRRRKSDKSPIANLSFAVTKGPIDMVLLLGALGLLAWVFFGYTSATQDLTSFVAMFPIGSVEFWVGAYLFAAFGMTYLVAFDHPPLASLLVGGELVIIWSWSFFARTLHVYTAQTGNATSLLYILIGVLILQRSGKNE